MAIDFLATELKTIHAEAYGTLIRRLREAREKAGITQTTLAARLGSRQTFVSKYETHERLLDPIEYVQIALAIGTDPYAILRECEHHLRTPLERTTKGKAKDRKPAQRKKAARKRAFQREALSLK